MPGETSHLVSVEQFSADLDRYIAAVREGKGPIAVLRDAEVVGVFMAPEEYEAAQEAALRKLLKSRMKGPTVSQEEARARVRDVLKRTRKKS